MPDNNTFFDNSDSVGIMDVASLSLARQYLANRSFPNRPVDMVASNNGLHFVALELTHPVRTNPRIIVGVANCHTHKRSFLTIRESFHLRKIPAIR